jgi:hypothetical protein
VASERDPVGTKTYRVTKAIHWHFTTEKTWEEISEKLGVSKSVAKGYVNEPPADEVRAMMENQATQVRVAALEELKRQLRECGAREESAEKPVKIWRSKSGDVHVRDVRDDQGGLVERIPLPQDFEMGDDEEAKFYARSEAREIMDMMIDLTGAAEPEEVKLSGSVEQQHTGPGGGQLSIGFEPTPLEDRDEEGEP